MENMIKTATLNTAEDIRNLCTALSVDHSFEVIPATLAEKVKTFNRLRVLSKASLLVQKDRNDFFRSILCISTDQPYSAIVAETVTLKLTESGNIEVNDSETALVFNDFMEAKIRYFESTHTDKDTKADREKAIRYFFGKNGVGLLQCLAYSSATAEKLDGVELKKSADMLTAYATIKADFEKAGKENPFDGSSGRKKVAQLEIVFEDFTGEAATGWQYTKHHFDGVAKMIATVSKKGVFTIDNLNGVMQSFITITRHAYNHLNLSVKDKAGILPKPQKTK